jgi:prepilin-type N-terminal cleavage/methylation domain-containing protein
MHKKLTKRNEQTGFTIIEVVLVLAIAGLIFLIVFLALPALQRSRRDTQRKSDAAKVLSALESYAGNNNGSYPAANTSDASGNFGTGVVDPGPQQSNSFWGQFMAIGDGVRDPSTGNNYIAVVTGAANAAVPQGQVRYVLGTNCAGAAGTRSVSVVVHQESGGFSCQDNQ